MRKRSILLLLWDKNDDFHKWALSCSKIIVENGYWTKGKFIKGIRTLSVKSGNYKAASFFMDKWKDEINSYDTVIIHASYLAIPIIQYINHHSNARVVVWFWNKIDEKYRVSDYESLNCELWTFDQEDSIRFHMKQNHQFYFKQLADEKSKSLPKVEYDIGFCGADKGRAGDLMKLRDELTRKGLSTELFITPSRNTERVKGVNYRKPAPYNEIVQYTLRARAVLDYVQEGQQGLTLRPLEALFFHKKLITNNKSIKNEAFYHPQNIFILGEDDFETIHEFLESPAVIVKEEVMNAYTFEDWIHQFEADE